jgi:hypothetical protein
MRITKGIRKRAQAQQVRQDLRSLPSQGAYSPSMQRSQSNITDRAGSQESPRHALTPTQQSTPTSARSARSAKSAKEATAELARTIAKMDEERAGIAKRAAARVSSEERQATLAAPLQAPAPSPSRSETSSLLSVDEESSQDDAFFTPKAKTKGHSVSSRWAISPLRHHVWSGIKDRITGKSPSQVSPSQTDDAPAQSTGGVKQAWQVREDSPMGSAIGAVPRGASPAREASPAPPGVGMSARYKLGNPHAPRRLPRMPLGAKPQPQPSVGQALRQ